jgi:hypothetical protein
MSHTPGTAATENDGDFGPSQAAVCLGIAGFIARQQRRSAVWS